MNPFYAQSQADGRVKTLLCVRLAVTLSLVEVEALVSPVPVRVHRVTAAHTRWVLSPVPSYVYLPR